MLPDPRAKPLAQIVNADGGRRIADEICAQSSFACSVDIVVHDGLSDTGLRREQCFDLSSVDKLSRDSDPVIDSTQMDEASV